MSEFVGKSPDPANSYLEYFETEAFAAGLTPRTPAELKGVLIQVSDVYMQIMTSPNGSVGPGFERGASYLLLLFDLLDAHDQDASGTYISFAELFDRADALDEAMYGNPLESVLNPANGKTAQAAALDAVSIQNIKDLLVAGCSSLEATTAVFGEETDN